MKFIYIFLLLIPNLTLAHDSTNLNAPPHLEYDQFQKKFIIDSYAKRVHLTRELVRCIANWTLLNHQSKNDCRHTAHFLNLTNAMIHENGAFGQPMKPQSLPK